MMGCKVKQSLLTNKSELRRVATAGFVCGEPRRMQV